MTHFSMSSALSLKNLGGFIAFWMILLVSWASPLHAASEYLSKSQLDLETRQEVHDFLVRILPEKYVDVVVMEHRIIFAKRRKAASSMLSGVSIATDRLDSEVVFTYRTINLILSKPIDLGDIESQVRAEINLRVNDKFAQSVLLDKRQIKRPNFSKFAEYVDVLAQARTAISAKDMEGAKNSLKRAAEISFTFPRGYEMLGFDRLFPDYSPIRSQNTPFTFIEWAMIGLSGFLVVLLAALFFWISRLKPNDEKDGEALEHPLHSPMQKVASALESMSAKEEEEEEAIQAEAVIVGDSDQIDYFDFLKTMPLADQSALLSQVTPEERSLVLTQIDIHEGMKLVNQMPQKEALEVLLHLDSVVVSKNRMGNLRSTLMKASENLAMQFNGMNRISELSGQFDAETWSQILAGFEGIESKASDSIENTHVLFEKIKKQSLSFEQIHQNESITPEILGRVLERYEKSRIDTGLKTSIASLLFEAEPSLFELLTSDYPSDTIQYFKEQLESMQKQITEDPEQQERIMETRKKNRSIFMRYLHMELNQLKTSQSNATQTQEL